MSLLLRLSLLLCLLGGCGPSVQLRVTSGSWARIIRDGGGCVTTPRGSLVAREIVVDELVTSAGPQPRAHGQTLRTLLLIHGRPSEPPVRLVVSPTGGGGGLISPLGPWSEDAAVNIGYAGIALGGLTLAVSLIIAGVPLHYGGLPEWLGGLAIAGASLIGLGASILLATLIARETRSPDGPRRLEPCADREPLMPMGIGLGRE